MFVSVSRIKGSCDLTNMKKEKVYALAYSEIGSC
jgi:hypothetical protein